MPLKILYIVSTLKRCGPNNQLFNIIKHLDHQKFSACITTLSPEQSESRWEDFKQLNVKLCSLNLSRIAGLFLAQKKLINLISEIKPDIIHTQGIRADILSSKSKTNIPLICTIRNFPQHDYPMNYGNIIGNFVIKKHLKFIAEKNLCIGVSNAVTQNLKKQFNLKNIGTIPNGVDTVIYYPVTKKEKTSLRRQLSLPPDKKIWDSSGHLSQIKNPEIIISAFQNTFKNSPDHVLIFIGTGNHKNQCAKLIKSPNIILKGRVNNVADFLQSGDYYVSASRAEGMPNAVLEAMACGLAVLLSDIAPHKEIYSLDPDIGLTFKTDSQQSLESQMLALINKDSAAMSKASLDVIKNSLSAEKMSQSYQQIYEKLIKK
jgi:glycosyltransferase involved in cell wall biosynthesis